jgi:hypothetical protein
MIDSMLRSREINKAVHERLLRLMAKSFHSAMISRMLISDRTQDTQEEVYIASLLHDLGEIAFWSMGGEITEKLDQALRASNANKTETVRNILGTSFAHISVGLVSAWNLGDMLVRAIEDPDKRTPEMRAVGLACQYSAASMDPKSDVNATTCLREMSELTKASPQHIKNKLKKCTEESVKLAVSYGARALTPYLDPNAEPAVEEQEEVQHKPDELMQLKLLRELTQIANEQGDLNLLINTTIEGMHRGVGMDRVIVFMLNQAKDRLKPRFVSCQNAERIETGFVFPLGERDTVFDEVYEEHQPVWVDDPDAEMWRKRMTSSIYGLTQGLAFFVAPIMVNRKCIGLIYGDTVVTERELGKEDFAAFNHFTGQLSLCLSHRTHS